MKRINLKVLSTIMLCFTVVFAIAQEKSTKGVQFVEGSWLEVQEMAKETGKPIFVDAYASWCGPCKAMLKEVFPQKKVGKYMNENYISYKLDMEKGDGVEFAMEYGVKSYPTFLFFNEDAELQHKTLGYKEAEEFVADAENAAHPERSLIALTKKYEDGARDKRTVQSYAMALRNANMPSAKVAQEYISKLTKQDLTDEDNQKFVFIFADNIKSKAFDLLVDNKAQFADAFGAEKVDQKIQRCALKSVALAAEDEENVTMSSIKKVLKTHGGSNSKALINNAYMSYNQATQNWKQYAKYASKYIGGLKEDNSSLLNNIAWSFYENVDDPKMLAKAVDWAKKSVDLDCQYYNCDTYAALLYKTAQYEKAKMAAEKAIEQAKASGDGHDETKELLGKINKALKKVKS